MTWAYQHNNAANDDNLQKEGISTGVTGETSGVGEIVVVGMDSALGETIVDVRGTSEIVGLRSAIRVVGTLRLGCDTTAVVEKEVYAIIYCKIKHVHL